MLYLCKLHNPWLHRQYRNISTKLTKNDASPIPPRTTKYKTNLVIGKTNHKNQCLNGDTFCNLDNTLATCPILWLPDCIFCISGRLLAQQTMYNCVISTLICTNLLNKFWFCVWFSYRDVQSIGQVARVLSKLQNVSPFKHWF
jgi:hypothetical protein